METVIIPLVVIVVLVLFVVVPSLRICSEWERKVVLRLGRFTGVRHEGRKAVHPGTSQAS